MSSSDEPQVQADIPNESANTQNEDAPEYTPNPLAGQGEDITADKDGGVLKVIKVHGDETEVDRVAKGDMVVVHYVGTLMDGRKFDSSRDRGQKFEFQIGERQVIKGWDIGIATMRRGEVAVLTCTAAYAYGDNVKGDIPAGSTLVFEVELFDWRGEDITEENDRGIIKRTLVPPPKTSYGIPTDESEVEVHLIGSYQGKVFEERDLKFVMDEGPDYGVVQGVEDGIRKMKEGEKAQLIIKPKYAFKGEGNKEFNIPANATVQYVVDLKKLKEAKDTWEMDMNEKIEAAELCKNKGTAYYKDGNIHAAERKWKRVVFLLETETGLKEDEKIKSDALQLSVNLNLALVHLKSKDYGDAIKVCSTALEFDTVSEKGFFRRGQAYFGSKDIEKAREDFVKVLELAPENKAAMNKITQCNQKIKEELDKERRMYKKMFATMTNENKEKEEQKIQEIEENSKTFPIESANDRKSSPDDSGESDKKEAETTDPVTEDEPKEDVQPSEQEVDEPKEDVQPSEQEVEA